MTGATGFLGSKLLERFLDHPKFSQVTIIKRSFSDTRRISHLSERHDHFDIDRTQIPQLFRDRTYDAIVHCATNYGRRFVSCPEIIESNLVLPLKLLEQGVNNGVRIFINSDTILNKNVSDYSLSKRQFREWLQSFSERIRCINLSLEHFYGPGDNNTKFVTDIIHRLLLRVPSIDLTEGNQTRDFIYIDDVVDAFILLLLKDKDPQGYSNFEVGSGHSIAIKEFVGLLKRLCGNNETQLNFGAIPYRAHELMQVKIDTSPLNSLGWVSRWDLEEGLKQSIDFERKLLA